MALSATTEAIGAVSDLLSSQVSARLSNLPVLVGRPSDAASSPGGRRLNLFLYRVAFDPQMRNIPLDAGQQPPLWLVLHYLLTAYDNARESESPDAHRLLGQGLVALQELNYLFPPVSMAALLGNPEPLKVTFDDVEPDLVSKLVVGDTERYRVSAGFQVRPVMLATDVPPQAAPLVLSVGPPATPGVMVLPSMGARILSIVPARFAAGEVVTLRGVDFGGYTRINLGGNVLTPLAPEPGDRGDVMRFQLPANTPVAAAGYAVSLARTLPSGHEMTSSPILGELMPRVDSVALSGVLTPVDASPGAALHGSFTVTGAQFGGAGEAVFAALYGDAGTLIQLAPSAPAGATSATFTVPAALALPAATYRVLLRVNGQQAPQAPELVWA